MFQDALQNRAHNGDQSAFQEIYTRYSREVYAIAHTALGSADSARAVVKQVFLRLYRELMRTEVDLDLPARLSTLMNEEIRITRIASGDLSPDALQVQYTVSADRTDDDTMLRIRSHMQQRNAAPEETPQQEVPAAEEPEAELFDEPKTAVDFFAEEPDEESAPETAEQEEAPDPVQVLHDDDAPRETKSHRGGAVFAGILLIVLLLIFAWLVVGILMDLEILPLYDLGYSLFNEYVFDFFRLP